MKQEKHNAFWQLFSANINKVAYGTAHYTWQSRNISTVINQLYEKYQQEGLLMPYTVEDYLREYGKDRWKYLTVEDRLEGLTIEDRLKGLSIEERLRNLKPEERLVGLKAEELLEILKLIPAEKLHAYLKQLEKNSDQKH